MRAKNVQEGEANKRIVKGCFFFWLLVCFFLAFQVPTAPERVLSCVPQCLAQVSSSGCVQCPTSQRCLTLQ